jgi:hypothetical protein
MNEQQKYASALTFAKRYSFCNSLGILTGDEDTDGRTDREKPVAPNAMEPAKPSDELRRLAGELWRVLATVRGAEKTWLKANHWLWDNGILDGAVPEEAPNLTVKQFEDAILKAKEILK